MGERNLVIFMPWLHLGEAATVAGIEWVPWKLGYVVNPRLRDFDVHLATILSGYVDIHGETIRNCTVACVPGAGPNLPDELFDVARRSASLLFLASWARNSYFQQIDFSYVNSSLFRLVGQRFSGEPVYIAVGSRRRDGQTLDGGYAHGEVRFTAPLQCRLGEIATIDLDFLNSLGRADAVSTPSIAHLRRALPFVELANSDDDFMTPMPEAILMAAAFEQLLIRNEESSARRVAGRFAEIFKPYGRVSVADAIAKRPGVRIDPRYRDSQLDWWLHQKWIEELYDLRSKSIHSGSLHERQWGWTTFEHLIMSAVLFPLMLKLLLEDEGHYKVSDADLGMALAVDKLLAEPKWSRDDDGERVWGKIVSRSRFSEVMRLKAHQFFEKHSTTDWDD